MKAQSKIAAILLITLIGLFSQPIVSSDYGSLNAAGHKKNQKENRKEKRNNDPKEEKVLMCHTPPGNPANKHEIWVCPDDVQNHLAHGDILGSCTATPPDPCEACESTFMDCFNRASGDPDIIAVCEAERAACLNACGGTPAPASVTVPHK